MTLYIFHSEIVQHPCKPETVSLQWKVLQTKVGQAGDVTYRHSWSSAASLFLPAQPGSDVLSRSELGLLDNALKVIE